MNFRFQREDGAWIRRDTAKNCEKGLWFLWTIGVGPFLEIPARRMAEPPVLDWGDREVVLA